MKRLLFTLFGFILSVSKVIIPLIIGVILACCLCNIHDNETYSWLSGIWHGIFFIPNLIRNLINPDILFKAAHYTTMYNIYWWLVSTTEVIMTLPVILFVLVATIAAVTTPQKDLDNIFNSRRELRI